MQLESVTIISLCVQDIGCGLCCSGNQDYSGSSSQTSGSRFPGTWTSGCEGEDGRVGQRWDEKVMEGGGGDEKVMEGGGGDERMEVG